MARRLRHVLKDHLHTSQFCGVPGNSILEAVSLVRDATAYSETSGTPLCVLTGSKEKQTKTYSKLTETTEQAEAALTRSNLGGE